MQMNMPIQTRPDPVVAVTQTSGQLRQCSARDVVTLLVACAGHASEQLLNEIGARLAEEAEKEPLPPRLAANALWAFASSALLPPSGLLAAARVSVLERTRELNPGDCAQLAWALVRLGKYDKDVFEALMDAVPARAAELRPKDIGMLCWAAAKVTPSPGHGR